MLKQSDRNTFSHTISLTEITIFPFAIAEISIFMTIMSWQPMRNMSSSDDENMQVLSEDSEDSLVLATGDFVPYDKSAEPVAFHAALNVSFWNVLYHWML